MKAEQRPAQARAECAEERQRKRWRLSPGQALWLAGLLVLFCLWRWADPWLGLLSEAMQGSPVAAFICALAGPFGKTGRQLILLGLCGGLAWIFWGPRRAVAWLSLTLLCLVSVGLTAQALKLGLRRPRPGALSEGGAARSVEAVWRGESGSFPSGDAASVFAIAMATLPFAPRAAAGLFMLGFLVGGARFYDGRHYFSDIWGSLLLSTGMGAWLTHWWRRKWGPIIPFQNKRATTAGSTKPSASALLLQGRRKRRDS